MCGVNFTFPINIKSHVWSKLEAKFQLNSTTHIWKYICIKWEEPRVLVCFLKYNTGLCRVDWAEWTDRPATQLLRERKVLEERVGSRVVWGFWRYWNIDSALICNFQKFSNQKFLGFKSSSHISVNVLLQSFFPTNKSTDHMNAYI